MKNEKMTLKRLKGISAQELLDEIREVRKRVSGYSDQRRSELVVAARGIIRAHK